MDARPEDKRMRLRRAGTCRVCGLDLPAGTDAVYEKATRTVRCVEHIQSHGDTTARDDQSGSLDVSAGIAGASARREFDRRKAQREERVRAKHPRIGSVLLAVTNEPQSTRAWDIGARGEEQLGHGLDSLASETVRLLHDRRIPKSKANIDHLAVTPIGVWVIDAKRYRGRPRLKVEGGLLRPREERLIVGTRDCTKLVDGSIKQVATVRSLLDPDVPVHGVLCFVDSDWPMLGRAFTTRGVHVLWPRRLRRQLGGEGPLSAGSIAEVHWTLARALPSA